MPTKVVSFQVTRNDYVSDRRIPEQSINIHTQAINNALEIAMKADDKSMIFGEDVGLLHFVVCRELALIAGCTQLGREYSFYHFCLLGPGNSDLFLSDCRLARIL